MVDKAFHTGSSACVWHVYFRIQKYSFGHMAVCRKIVYHGTESKKYMCMSQGRNFRSEKQKDGEKQMHDNSSLGTVEIILILTVLIVLIFIFMEKIAGLAAFYMGSMQGL